jgi:hypothetical protein
MYLCLLLALQADRKRQEDDALVDICSGRKVFGVTSDVDRVLGLIHTHPVDSHHRRERQVHQVDETEVRGHPQVHDKILQHEEMSQAVM